MRIIACGVERLTNPHLTLKNTASIILSVRRLAPLVAILLLSQCIGAASVPQKDPGERVRAFTRSIEFDYVTWTWDAVWIKIQQTALGIEKYLDEKEQSQFVRDYMALVSQIQMGEAQLSILHANPDQKTVEQQIQKLQEELAALYAQRAQRAPLAESILQSQLGAVIAQLALTEGGQTIPPLLFHGTPLPWALIVSRRDVIAQEANISLETELTLEEHIALEQQVAQALDLSTLVVPVGGVGTYPTMVAQNSDLNWLAEVISHEWTHNYLTLRPLGLLYSRSGELTTMNETTANISGKEIGAALIARFYPELVPPPPPPASSQSQEQAVNPPPAPVFDFRAEMHATRIRVDALLAKDKVEEAEVYMEARRLVFWEHGYAIRKLNQAYFAFYGSYADTPIGPAGEDPVGTAVRELRARSASLAEFLQRMAPLTSFADLQALLANLGE